MTTTPTAASDPVREALPRLTRDMIKAAMLAHYGKRTAAALGICGVDLTANDVNYTFEQGFRRMWAGIRKHLAALPPPAPAEPIDVAGVREAAQAVIDRMCSTYKARNGREVGIQGDDGEKCWIVHSDDIETLRYALALTPPASAPQPDTERAVSIARQMDALDGGYPQPDDITYAGAEMGAAVAEVINSAWALCDDTENASPPTVPQASWDRQSAALDRLEALIPKSEKPCWPGRAVRLLAPSVPDDKLRAALTGLVTGVEQFCNEPGGPGISGYLSARLSDARNILAALAHAERETGAGA